MSVFFTKRGAAAQTGKLLGDYAEGDIVYLNESGSPVEFYVAKHDYESGLNGSGRTLLVRKDCYASQQWNTSSVSTWATCSLRSWLNLAYLELLDADVQTAVDATTYFYTVGNGDDTLTTRSDAVFLLSAAELGCIKPNYFNTEGSTLTIASTLQIAHLNGSAVKQWTRTPSNKNWTPFMAVFRESGACDYINVTPTATGVGSRPIFTLPSTTLFNKDDTFKGA